MNSKDMGTVFCFGVTKPHLQSLDLICRRSNLLLKEVQYRDYESTIGEITGIMPVAANREIKENPAIPPFQDEMLLFSFLTDNQLNSVLEGLRKERINIPLKAMLTPNNMSWTPVFLREQLLEEVAAMKKAMEKQKNK